MTNWPRWKEEEGWFSLFLLLERSLEALNMLEGSWESEVSLSVGSGCIGKRPLDLLLPSSFSDLLLQGLVVERSVSSAWCC